MSLRSTGLRAIEPTVVMRFAKIIKLTMYLNQSSSYYSGGVYYYSTPLPAPTAHVTVSRNRLKLYGENVYMKDGTSFEIELWNPRPNRVLAKISINGISVSGGGIVVNPGQRVYLERFLEEDRKFKFITYEAENSAEGRAAIANNGLVTVEFYDEIFDRPNWTYRSDATFMSNNLFNQGTASSTARPTFTTGQCLYNSSITGSADSNMLNFKQDLANRILIGSSRSKCSNRIETGRIEKGERSDQKIVNTYGDFSFFACAYYTVKILPESQKPVEIGEIRSYCTKCGRRWRSGENFCSACGTPRNQ